MLTLEPETLCQLLSEAAAKHPHRPALKQKSRDTGEWMTITYGDFKLRVECIAKAFIKLGLERGSCIAILANNSAEWAIAQFAAVHVAALATGIYTINSAEACLKILEKCKAQIIVVDSDEQLWKILEFKSRLHHLRAIVQTLPTRPRKNDVLLWSDLELMETKEVAKEYEERLTSISPDTPCLLFFTSGTTGDPKGVLLTHDNITFTANSMLLHWNSPEIGCERIVSFLPYSHIGGQLFEIFVSIKLCATVFMADSDALRGSLLQTLLEVRPTRLLGVPRIFEKIHERVSSSIAESGYLKRYLLSWAQATSTEFHERRIRSGGNSSNCKLKIAKQILSTVKSRLGLDHTRFLIVGAAPICLDTLNFFFSLDLPIYELYGLTESTGCIASNVPHCARLGTVGRPPPGVEVKLENGEICMRGRSRFNGYLNDVSATAEVIDSKGWLRTGDLGSIDADGFVSVTGRRKELIITAGGENIPFLRIERLVLAECEAIANALVVGDRRRFLSLLITLKCETEEDGAMSDRLASESLRLMTTIGVNHTLTSEARRDAKVLAALQNVVDRVNAKAISRAQHVHKFVVLEREFSIATGELTATMKIKRSFIIQKYGDVIERMYL